LTVEATLCEIISEGRLLLQRKATGRFGEGKWNGPGGNLGPGESPGEGVVREVFEETGLRVYDLHHHGVLYHYFGQEGEPDWAVHIFSTGSFHGKLKEGDEGELRWFPVDRIPYGEMWEDDIHWLPLLLEGKDFEGAFYFNENASRLLDFRLNTR